MKTLFGQSELEKLRDLEYKTESHNFSKGVIAAYYNGMEYPMEVVKDWFIRVKRKKDYVYFCLKNSQVFNDKLFLKTIDSNKATIYSKEKTLLTPKKTKEVVYDLTQIFVDNPAKNIKRAWNLDYRADIGIREIQPLDDVKGLYDEWVAHKMADPKVFRISFTPKRYIRSFQLKGLGFNIWDQAYFVNGELYATICYEVQGDTAFELAFISKFWDKKLKVINDLNECILINSFYALYMKGVRKVNVGPTGGIKGLRTFKNKLPHSFVEIYSN